MEKDSESGDILNDHGIHLFMSDFDSSSVAEAIRFILEKNLLPPEKRPSHLTLIINSEGGNLHDAFALVDIMRGSKLPIHTVGIGCVMSCGLITFMAGDVGFRSLTPNTSILSHQYSWGSEGKEHELLATIKEYELTRKRLMNHYKKYTGLKEKQVTELLMPPHDVYLDAKEAVKYGLADKIINTP